MNEGQTYLFSLTVEQAIFLKEIIYDTHYFGEMETEAHQLAEELKRQIQEIVGSD